MIQISKISATAFFVFRLPLRACVFDPMVVFDWLFLAQSLQDPSFCMKKIKKPLGYLENGQNFFFLYPGRVLAIFDHFKTKKFYKKTPKKHEFYHKYRSIWGVGHRAPRSLKKINSNIFITQLRIKRRFRIFEKLL